MFVLRIALTIAIAALVSTEVNAQLFRFRRSVPRQTPSSYNAQAYQYTQPRQPMSTIPSEKNDDGQDANGAKNPTNNGNSVLTSQSRNADPRSDSVMRTYRDRRTGRLLRRPESANQSVANGTNPLAARNRGLDRASASRQPNGQQQLGQASSSVLNASILENSNSRQIARASFDCPIDETEKLYSIFVPNEESDAKTPTAAESVLEELPILDPPAPPLDKSESSALEIDLPPLDKNSK